MTMKSTLGAAGILFLSAPFSMSADQEQQLLPPIVPSPPNSMIIFEPFGPEITMCYTGRIFEPEDLKAVEAERNKFNCLDKIIADIQPIYKI